MVLLLPTRRTPSLFCSVRRLCYDFRSSALLVGTHTLRVNALTRHQRSALSTQSSHSRVSIRGLFGLRGMTNILKSDPAPTGTSRARIHLTDSDSAISPRRHPPGPAASSRCCIRTADAPTLQPASASRESASLCPKWSSLTSCAQPPPRRPHIVFSATVHVIVY